MYFMVPQEFPRFDLRPAVRYVALMLNALTPSYSESSSSAMEVVTGKRLNFKDHPLLPFGTRVEYLIPTPQSVTKESARTVTGFYVGPALYNYQSVQILSKATRQSVIRWSYWSVDHALD